MVQPRVPKKPYPKVAIALAPERRVDSSSRRLPQTPSPVSRLLLDVFICSGKVSRSRPAANRFYVAGDAVLAECRGPAGYPLHFWKSRKHRSHHLQATGVQLVAGIESAHDLACRTREARVQRRIESFVWLAHPRSQMRFICPNNFLGPVRRA